jgi:alpha-beta hydrolase superfamily lysophospholipase
VRPLVKHVALFFAYGALCVVATLVAVYLHFLQSQPDLRPWHTAELDAEFRAADASTVKSLDDYRRVEDRVFAQLQGKVYAKVAEADRRAIDRYSSGSLSDPTPHRPDWNRTFELAVDSPRGGAVLLHGLTDAPYTMRAIAQRLHAKGYWLVGLRLPGHGTAPSGILYANWEDWAAATRLAARHVRGRIGPDRPLLLVGYSSGAGLAVEYAAARLQGEDLPKVDSLVLLSPAIGLSRAAALAGVQSALGRVDGFEKAAWTAIVPEYDPFKYNSFTAHAGDQIHRVTRRIDAQLTALGGGAPVKGMPRILAFQSVADATVSTPAVVNALFRRLAPEGHALVFFDINRHAEAEPLFDPAARKVRGDLLDGPPLPFDLTALVNEDAATDAVVALHRRAGATGTTREATGLAWPPSVFSLSHIALPFPPDDPVYGAVRPAQPALLFLGRPELLGERGLLAVSPSVLMRLRHNPFFAYVEKRLDEFL